MKKNKIRNRIINLYDISKIRQSNLYFIIEYKSDDLTYSDILHHSEIYTDKATANNVFKITPINNKYHYTPLQGIKAVKLILRLSQWNK